MKPNDFSKPGSASVKDEPRIVVVGSLNVDHIAQVVSLPLPGQTVIASNVLQRFGGKGANQAVAAARQGASVSMIACLGNDDAGAAYRAHLARECINDKGVTTLPDTTGGSAMITVDQHGENQIIVCPGANGLMTAAHVRSHEALIASADVIILQWEVPQPAVIETLSLAEKHHIPVVLNPSPLHGSFPWGEHAIHTLIVNEGEAESIFGKGMANFHSIGKTHAISHLVITRGANPTLGFSIEGNFEIPAEKVTPVDTVGAGDTFAGTYAACLARNLDFKTSLQYANVAGSLAVLKAGAQEAIPYRSQVTEAILHREKSHPSSILPFTESGMSTGT